MNHYKISKDLKLPILLYIQASMTREFLITSKIPKALKILRRPIIITLRNQ